MAALVPLPNVSNIAHPGVYWAKYLLSQRQFTYDQISAAMVLDEIGGLEPAHLEAIEQTLDFPRPFVPAMKEHAPSQVWLREQRIYEIWHPCRHMEIAWSILAHPLMRRAVETMALSPFRPDKAAAKLERTIGRQVGIELTPRAYELFCHYFWNGERMTAQDWGDFVIQSGRKYGDLLSLAANLKGPNAGQILMSKLGLGSLRRIEGHQGYLDFRGTALSCAAQIAGDQPSPAHARMLLAYARTFDLAQKGIDETGGAQEDIAMKFRGFNLKREDTQVPAMNDLEGGVSIPAIGGDDDGIITALPKHVGDADAVDKD